MDTTRERRIGTLAAAQGGVFTEAQAAECGFPRSARRRRLRIGTWQAARRRVVRPATTPASFDSVLWEAVLYAGPRAVVSHFTAALLHGLSAPADERIWVTVQRTAKCRRPPALRLVRSRRTPRRTVDKQGHRVTTVARTLVDLAAHLPAREMRAVAHDAIQRRLVSAATLDHEVRRSGGCRGLAALRAVVEDATGLSESVLEAEAAHLFARAGLELQRQVTISVGGTRCRVDFLHSASQVVIEVDGLAFHSSRAAMQNDRSRDRLLSRNGYLVIRCTADHIREGPGRLTRDVAAIVASRSP